MRREWSLPALQECLRHLHAAPPASPKLAGLWFATTAHGPADDPDEDGVTTAAELSMGRSPHFGIIPDPVLAQRATGLEIYTPHP